MATTVIPSVTKESTLIDYVKPATTTEEPIISSLRDLLDGTTEVMSYHSTPVVTPLLPEYYLVLRSLETRPFVY